MTEQEFNHQILPLAGNIYSLAVHLTGERERAADITQDVILKLWDNRNGLERIVNHKAWALTITRNLCFDLLKKRQPVYSEEEMLRNAGVQDDLFRQIETQETLELVRQIIGTLPTNQREVIWLREIEELEFEEIARITGLSSNNIRVLLSRARSKVKEILFKKYRISQYEL